MRLKIVFLLLSLLSLSACAVETTYPTYPSPPLVTSKSSQEGYIADLDFFPQSLNYYANKLASQDLISPKEHAKQVQKFRNFFFSAWTITKSNSKAKKIFEPLSYNGYGENLLPRTEQDKVNLKSNANQKFFPSLFLPAITVRNTSVRDVPSLKPRFNDPKLAGEGFPFDMAQYSTLALGTPARIVHQSLDKAWYFIETALVSGWVLSQDLAIMNKSQVQEYMKLPLVSIIHEKTSLLEAKSKAFIASADIGTIIPKSNGQLLVYTRNSQGLAVKTQVIAQNKAYADFPLKMTGQNMAYLGNQIMGQKYGWGGLYENRDCSQFTKDLMSAFGIWLPRNSAVQAKAWDYIDISKQNSKEKEASILKLAKPFKSLIWLPGHIVLYIGEYEGRAAVMHNIWGLRTVDKEGKEGRFVIGRTIISSLELGLELPNLAKNASLLERVKGIAVLND